MLSKHGDASYCQSRMLSLKQNKTKQNKTKQNKTKQNKTKQNKQKQTKTKQKQNKNKQKLIKLASKMICFCKTQNADGILGLSSHIFISVLEMSSFSEFIDSGASSLKDFESKLNESEKNALVHTQSKNSLMTFFKKIVHLIFTVFEESKLNGYLSWESRHTDAISKLLLENKIENVQGEK